MADLKRRRRKPAEAGPHREMVLEVEITAETFGSGQEILLGLKLKSRLNIYLSFQSCHFSYFILKSASWSAASAS